MLTAADAAAQRTALGVPAGSGNSTGTNTGDQTNITGNAGTATALQTARNINGVAFDGTANITINAVDSTARVAKAGDTMTGALNWSATQTIASATTTDIGAATSNSVIVSGTTTITGLGTIAAGAERVVQFSGALTLTHNATSLILPGGDSITTAAGDVAYFVSLGAGNWRCTGYQKANGQSVVASGGSPGGSSGNLQYNNAGAFGAVTGSSVSGADITLAAGTRTASGTTLTITETRNNGAVAFPGALIVNTTETASAAATKVVDFQTGGTSRLSVNKAGTTQLNGINSTGYNANVNAWHWSLYGDVAGGISPYAFGIGPNNVNLSLGTGISSDRFLVGHSSGTYATFVQDLGFYASSKISFGSAESVAIALNATGVIEVNNNTAGTFRDVKLRSLISSGGTITLSNYTVATLPTAASNTHAIVAVTDGNASPTYRGAVTGGGSTKGVVYCDGSSWMWH